MAKQRSRPTRRRDRKAGGGGGRRKSCQYCRDKVEFVDYKDITTCASSSPTAARSARAASPAPAAVTRTRSPARSSAPVSWRCCRTSARAPTPTSASGGRGGRGRDRDAERGAAMPQAILLQDHRAARRARARSSTSRKGYLRNYLIPRKLAEPATKGALAAAAQRRRRAERAARAGRPSAPRSRAAVLSRTVLTIAASGGRRRPPVRLGHPAGHRRTRSRMPAASRSTAARSTSRSRSAPSGPA